MLAEDDRSADQRYFILESGSGCHMVNDERMIEDPEDFQGEYVADEGGRPLLNLPTTT